MMLITKDGKKMFINDNAIESFKNNLDYKIHEYIEKQNNGTVTEEDIKEVDENMHLYNQIVEYEREEGLSPRM